MPAGMSCPVVDRCAYRFCSQRPSFCFLDLSLSLSRWAEELARARALAEAPHEVDLDGSSWMVPADASDGREFEEVQGAPVWCVHLTVQELLRRAFKVLRVKRECCPTCGLHHSGEQHVDELEDIEGKAQRLSWESYDDVPDATPEERGIYPAILKKFHEEGYPYLTGVRKLMARSPPAKAQPGERRSLDMDPSTTGILGILCSGGG